MADIQHMTHAVRMMRQVRINRWALRNWGAACMHPVERAERIVEEVIELAQALGVPLHRIPEIAAQVYAKPAGEVRREIGGVSICLLAVGASLGVNVDECEEEELSRIEALPPEHFHKRHAAKVASGMAQDLSKFADQITEKTGIYNSVKITPHPTDPNLVTVETKPLEPLKNIKLSPGTMDWIEDQFRDYAEFKETRITPEVGGRIEHLMQVHPDLRPAPPLPDAPLPTDPVPPEASVRLGFRLSTGATRFRRTWRGRLVLQLELMDRYLARARFASSPPILYERGPYWSDARVTDMDKDALPGLLNPEGRL